MQRIASGIENALNEAVGRTYAPSISIESAHPIAIERLLQRLSVLAGDGSDSPYRGELREQSLGGANLIYLALKLLEYELKLSSDRAAHFLLIEEPEAHIHTHVQKTLFTKLPVKNTQVIVTTHSTHVSSASKITSINVLSRASEFAQVSRPSEGLDLVAVGRVERYLDAVRSTLLFAKGVVLVEGAAEQIMLPVMLRAVFGLSPDELGFSVIAMDSAFFEHIAVIFHEDRLSRPCAIVTDLDTPLEVLPPNPDSDSDIQARARASGAAGRMRKTRLDAFTRNNRCLGAFYARHTFEVDFVRAGNSWEVQQTLNSIYHQEASKAASAAKLESEDIAIYGREVLRLAEKVGKGWFAVLLAEHTFARTYIPTYMLKAIAFAAKGSLRPATLKQMGEFRIKAGELDALLGNALPEKENLLSLAPVEFLRRYRDGAPDDQLTSLANALGV